MRGRKADSEKEKTTATAAAAMDRQWLCAAMASSGAGVEMDEGCREEWSSGGEASPLQVAAPPCPHQ
jgi:hypothetical protein